MELLSKLRPFVLVGIVGCHAQARNIERVLSNPESVSNDNIALMEYDRNHVFATSRDGKYERFEHKGFDGTVYCTQIFYLSESIKVIDGIDGFCDEYADAYILNYDDGNMVYFCDKDRIEENRCQKINEMVVIFNYLNKTDLIKSEWDKRRESCNEKKCFFAIKDKPGTMSKKKVK